MMISIDGACKRNGTPECAAVGVAWVVTEAGDMFYVSQFENTGSTSQRGELFGLLQALTQARAADPDEDIIIITDSEYLYNTVTKDWLHSWQRFNWWGGGGPVKNKDIWEQICYELDRLNANGERVFMQWTKGHIIHYTPGLIKQAMVQDSKGIELWMRINSVASRPADKPRIIADFNRKRKEHGHHAPPDDVAFDWACMNCMADALASFLSTLLDNIAI